MATKTWYLTNTIIDAVHQALSETSPGADATSSPNYGWTVGTTVAARYASADAGTEAAAATFSTTIQPDGTIVTTANAGDCWRTTFRWWGTFATGNWEFHCAVIAVSSATSQSGNAGFRLFTSPNADGSGATERTAGRIEGSAVTTLLTSAQQDSTITQSITGFTINGEYIFVQIGWEITTAATMSTADVIMRVGNTASRIVSADFTPTMPVEICGAGQMIMAP